MKTTLAIAIVSLMGMGTAAADSHEGASVGASAGSFGVGGNFTPTGSTGLGITYQMPQFHIDGIVGFTAGDGTNTDIAARFWYQVHGGELADLSIGGGLGIEVQSPDGGDTATNFGIDGGIKARVFLAPNCAVHGQSGLRIFIPDGEGVDNQFGVDGQLVSQFGFTYFFQ